jgi:acyl-CoA synthetase (AMP-forming)/AMP-acid ligase II
VNDNRLCIPDLIANRARQVSGDIAVTAPGRLPLTYGQLASQIGEMAMRLNEFGLGRNDRVAVVLPNGPEMAVAFLSVVSAATCAPLNPAYREKEFDYYLSDLNARALIVHAGIDTPAVTAAKKRGIPVLSLLPASDAEAGIFTLGGDLSPREVHGGMAQPQDVALLLHTSGTTSRPKIVPLTQANLCTSAHNIRSALQLTGPDRCLNVMPLFHIHGLVGAMLSSLAAGGSIVCTPGFHAAAFFDWMAEFRPTWLTAVPTIYQAILEHAANHHEAISRWPLRIVRSSSSALPPQVMTELEIVFGVPAIEAYGMTEASHQITSNPLPPRGRKAGSVGMAAGTEVAVMDESGNLVAAGETGEIVIRGANLTQGYENNPAANDGAFTNGWLRTGDQGYLDADDYLFITGRLKEIINRGGRKISPREVDDVLVSHPAVAQAVTFAIPHPSLGEDVAAAVVLRKDVSCAKEDIRAFAFSHLADYKVPSHVLIVEEIPKGPTGKPQRNDLADKLAGLLKEIYVAPRSRDEEMLAGIWNEVLDNGPIGVRDNFFLLGGDSIKATQVVSRVRDVFRVDLPHATLFQSPILADFSEAVAKRKTEGADVETLSGILSELEGLSEEETRRLLAGDSPGTPGERNGSLTPGKNS